MPAVPSGFVPWTLCPERREDFLRQSSSSPTPSTAAPGYPDRMYDDICKRTERPGDRKLPLVDHTRRAMPPRLQNRTGRGLAEKVG